MKTPFNRRSMKMDALSNGLLEQRGKTSAHVTKLLGETEPENVWDMRRRFSTLSAPGTSELSGQPRRGWEGEPAKDSVQLEE